MKAHHFDNSTFIGGWYIPEKVCDDMISFFKNNKKDTHNGLRYDSQDEKNVVDKKFKDSIDLTIWPDMFGNIEVFNYIQQLSDVIQEYEIKYPKSKYNSSYALTSLFNIQYYPPGGGFKTWHHERFKNTRDRVFVFMTYLNDVPDGGTEFYHQKITSPAKKGLTIMWPAEWTHIHRGQITQKNEKYIATGWFRFTD